MLGRQKRRRNTNTAHQLLLHVSQYIHLYDRRITALRLTHSMVASCKHLMGRRKRKRRRRRKTMRTKAWTSIAVRWMLGQRVRVSISVLYGDNMVRWVNCLPCLCTIFICTSTYTLVHLYIFWYELFTGAEQRTPGLVSLALYRNAPTKDGQRHACHTKTHLFL